MSYATVKIPASYHVEEALVHIRETLGLANFDDDDHNVHFCLYDTTRKERLNDRQRLNYYYDNVTYVDTLELRDANDHNVYLRISFPEPQITFMARTFCFSPETTIAAVLETITDMCGLAPSEELSAPAAPRQVLFDKPNNRWLLPDQKLKDLFSSSYLVQGVEYISNGDTKSVLGAALCVKVNFPESYPVQHKTVKLTSTLTVLQAIMEIIRQCQLQHVVVSPKMCALFLVSPRQELDHNKLLSVYFSGRKLFQEVDFVDANKSSLSLGRLVRIVSSFRHRFIMNTKTE